MESSFKVGDRVYHIEYGWGSVASVDKRQAYGLDVKFDRMNCNAVTEFTLNGFEFENARTSLLSFTEYTLQGFSQERPIVLPKVGDWCMVKNFHKEEWKLRKFRRFENGYFICEEPDVDIFVFKWEQLKLIEILD
jgi:hypothetical protein